MYTSSFKYSLLLLLSLSPISHAETTGAETINEISEHAPESQAAPTPAECLKHTLAAGHIITCEKHKIADDTNTQIHAIEEKVTFTSSVSGLGDGIIARFWRALGYAPQITITASTPYANDTQVSHTQFQRALHNFAENPDLSCTKTTDEKGNTISCSIMLALKEFNQLKEQYNSKP